MINTVKGHIIDVVTGEVKRNRVLKISKGKIVGIETRQKVTNQFLLPGLIDCHVHLVLESSPNYPAFEPKETSKTRKERVYRNLKQALSTGVTTVRDCGFPTEEIFQIREEINNNPSLGSRIFCAGPAITPPGGHARDLGVEVRGTRAMIKICKKLIAKNVDFIKLINNEPNSFTLEEIKTAVKIVHKFHKGVAMHLYQLLGLQKAIAARVDSIEHFGKATKDLVLKIKKQGIIVVPIYRSALDAVEHPEANVIGEEDINKNISVYGFNEWIPDLREGIKLLIADNVTLATGSDAGFLYTNFATVLREIPSLIELGLLPLKAIQAGTINGAKVLGKEYLVGSLEVGKIADVVVFDKNPLEDISVLQSPKRIYKEGLLVPN